MKSLALLALALPLPAIHFDHLHLNSTDPAAAMDYYASHFDCEKAGDGIRAQKYRLLFNQVDSPPPWELVSAIWHFGWGAEDMPTTYRKQLDMGTKFFTPLTDISDLAGVPRFFYAYVEGPDKALIELNTAAHHRFGHLHLFSDDPAAAGEWYVRNLGAVRRSESREVRSYRGFQVAPNASLVFGDVNILIFPTQCAWQSYPEQWKGRTALASTKGRVVDHIAFSAGNLPQAVGKLQANGVAVDGGFLEGPDRIRIELIETPKELP